MKRVKVFVLLQALLAASVILSSYTVKTVANTKLFWDEDSNLNWADFQNVRRSSDDDAAMSSIAIESRCVVEKNGAFIRVRASFDPTKSWVKYDCKTSYILNHEQMHYNIVEIYARKLRKAIAETEFNRKTFTKDFNILFDSIAAEHEAFQDRYDDETGHSILQARQNAWNDIIVNELESLEDYASPIVKLNFAN